MKGQELKQTGRPKQQMVPLVTLKRDKVKYAVTKNSRLKLVDTAGLIRFKPHSPFAKQVEAAHTRARSTRWRHR